MSALDPGTRVLWADLHDSAFAKHGTVTNGTEPAWTPNDLSATAPDADMITVVWDGDVQPCWEYVHELAPAPKS